MPRKERKKKRKKESTQQNIPTTGAPNECIKRGVL